MPLDPFVGKFSRVTTRTEIARACDHLLVRETEIPEELVGIDASDPRAPPEFRAAPINANTLVSCDELLGGPRALTFHEDKDGSAFQLMYTGHRLARRVAEA